MKGHFKLALAAALVFATAGVFGIAAPSANADVIANPGSAGSIPQVNSGNVLKDYNENSLNVVNNSTPQGNVSKSIQNIHWIQLVTTTVIHTTQLPAVHKVIHLRPNFFFPARWI